MSRPRTPTQVLELKGAFDKNPQRRRRDPSPAGPVGSAPVSLNEAERKIWSEICRKAPDKVLTAADSFLLEIVCRLMFRFRMPIAQCSSCGGQKVIGNERCINCAGRGVINQALEKGELNSLMQGIAKLGFTPVDRAKISVDTGKEEDSNPFAKFAGRTQ